MNDADTTWMRKIRQLEAAYAQEGRAALERMGSVESYVLYEEKAVALEAAERMLAANPTHERWRLRRDCLEAEAKDISGWIMEQERVVRHEMKGVDWGMGR